MLKKFVGVVVLRSFAPRGNNWRNCIDRCTYWDEKTTKNMGKVKVPTTSVESLLAKHPDIHMVKIDIEGAEMEILETVTSADIAPIGKQTAEYHHLF